MNFIDHLKRGRLFGGLLLLASLALMPAYGEQSEAPAPEVASTQAAVRFNRDIRPILSDKCFACHGPDGAGRQADLRLDTPIGGEGFDGAHLYAAIPGDVAASELAARIFSDKPGLVMPPPESHHTLTEAEKKLLVRWIEEGAGYEAHWSFSPIVKREPPVVPGDNWSLGAIDRHVFERLKSESMRPSSEADKRTLLRRLTFDLTGLPPTLEELADFVSDESPDAYEQRVDALLARPQYGEHMARHWADLVRLADTTGLHTDRFRDHSAYRDWVIHAFNANHPFDQFIRDQIAGDLHENPTTDQLVASGFNRLHPIFEAGSVLVEEASHRNVLDRVEVVGTAFLGLTVQCAQCHDHKYDPISQREFFQFYAFFDHLEGLPQTPANKILPKGIQEPFVHVPTPDQKAKLADMDAKREKLREALKAAPDSQDLQEQIDRINRQTQDLHSEMTWAMVSRESGGPHETRIRIAGAYDQLGDSVNRGTPAFLPPLQSAGDTADRMDLANWLVSPEHPLTARVTVNRFWQQIFGVGLVKTSEDFGAQGQWPSHPELLDDLTARFVDSGWNVKALMREIVLSATYRQQSDAPVAAHRLDPENRLLGRASRYRMDAEMIRDQMLMVSGKLNTQLYGTSVKPPQPGGLWESVTMTNEVYVPDSGPDIVRRSLYTFWKRTMPPPQMTIMNAPSREYCVSRRERTNTPLQALVLMNEPEYFKLARSCAERTLNEVGGDRNRAMSRLYERITSHQPTPGELAAMEAALDELISHYTDQPELAREIAPDAGDPPGVAAWTMIAHSLLNTESTKLRR